MAWDESTTTLPLNNKLPTSIKQTDDDEVANHQFFQ